MLTVKHPSKPVELRAQYGYVALAVKGQMVGNIADITLLTDDGKQRVIDQRQDPVGFKSLGYISLSPAVLSWIDDNKQPKKVGLQLAKKSRRQKMPLILRAWKNRPKSWQTKYQQTMCGLYVPRMDQLMVLQ